MVAHEAGTNVPPVMFCTLHHLHEVVSGELGWGQLGHGGDMLYLFNQGHETKSIMAFLLYKQTLYWCAINYTIKILENFRSEIAM